MAKLVFIHTQKPRDEILMTDRWRFKSGMQDEPPVIVLANIEVNFRLL
jgi:hypothetical protein